MKKRTLITILIIITGFFCFTTTICIQDNKRALKNFKESLNGNEECIIHGYSEYLLLKHHYCYFHLCYYF